MPDQSFKFCFEFYIRPDENMVVLWTEMQLFNQITNTTVQPHNPQ